MCKIFFSYPSPSTIFFLPLSLSQQLFSNSLYYLDSLIIVNVEFSNVEFSCIAFNNTYCYVV